MTHLARSILPLLALAVSACDADGQPTTPDAGTAGASPPNIVLILADDLGYSDLGAYGGDVIRTPRLDRMATEGVVLTDYYAPANVCTPSRAGLLTGRQPIRYGLAKGVIFPDSEGGLPPGEVTLAETLGAAGYATMMVGKWHLGHTDGHWPTDQGFERFFGVPYSNDMQPFPLIEGTDVIEETADQRTLTRRYTEAAVRFVESAEPGAPFFLYVAHTFPHIPLFASEAFEGRSPAGRYGDAVEEIDWSTGAILDALAAAGLERDTLVLFTSDNGPWFEGSAGGLRGRKGGAYEGGHRVPFIARWLGTLPGGETRSAPLTGLDVLPTLAKLADAPLPEAELDGADAWPAIAEGARSPHETILFFNEDQVSGLRQGDWHLVTQDYYKTYDVSLTGVGYPLLFDLGADPQMRYSQTTLEPERTARMLGLATDARERFGVPPPPPLVRTEE